MQQGQMLAHYRLEEKIGAGGMGEVFRATDSRLGRDVALKMLPDLLAHDPERLARFRREAQVLAALNHPGIASVFGLESQDDTHALAMELVPGPELAERLVSGPISVSESLEIALQLAEAIEAAHEKGIIHRDLKPANIKLTDEGRVKVLDFGLAKALVEETSASEIDQRLSPTLTANMTLNNVILGTAAYMSPEQARASEVDKRADIWAFGVVVTEMLGGRQLFAEDNVSDTLASVLKSEINLEELPEDVPQAVVRLLRRCLQRDPRQRLRDIGDARLVLQDVLAGNTEEAEVVLAAPASPWPLRVAALVAVVAIATAGWAILNPKPESALPLRKFEIPMTKNDSSVNVSFSPVISPDGRFLVFISQGQIWVRDLATTVSRPLPGTEDARNPFWSPDGEWIAFGTGNGIKKIDRSGGRYMTLATVTGNLSMGSGSSGSWNLDGSLFYTTGNTGVLRLSSQAGEVVLHHEPQEGEVDFHEMCALPDGRGWVFVVHDMNSFGNLGLLTSDGQRKSVLSFPDDALRHPVWSPSGHLLFHREKVAEGIWAVPFSLDKLEVTGEAFLVAAECQYPSVSSDGTLVYSQGVAQKKQKLALFDRQGNEMEVIGELQTTRPFPYLSPDETKILITAVTDGSRELWLFDTSGGAERRLTFDGLNWDSAIWHPDGNQFIGYTDPDYNSFLMTLDGSVPRQELGPGILSNLSADGQDWVYAYPRLDKGFDFDIYSRPLGSAPEEGRELISTSAIEWFPVLSPDGKYLLYTSNESGIDEVYVISYPDLKGRWQVSRDGGNWPCWGGDGKEIYFTTHHEMYAVEVDNEGGFQLGRPRKLFDRPYTGWTPAWPDGFDVTADGERFVMLKPLADDSNVQPSLVVVQNWFAEFAGD